MRRLLIASLSVLASTLLLPTADLAAQSCVGSPLGPGEHAATIGASVSEVETTADVGAAANYNDILSWETFAGYTSLEVQTTSGAADAEGLVTGASIALDGTAGEGPVSLCGVAGSTYSFWDEGGTLHQVGTSLWTPAGVEIDLNDHSRLVFFGGPYGAFDHAWWSGAESFSDSEFSVGGRGGVALRAGSFLLRLANTYVHDQPFERTDRLSGDFTFGLVF